MTTNMMRQTKMFANPLIVVQLAKKLPLHFKWTKNNKHSPQVTDTDRRLIITCLRGQFFYKQVL